MTSGRGLLPIQRHICQYTRHEIGQYWDGNALFVLQPFDSSAYLEVLGLFGHRLDFTDAMMLLRHTMNRLQVTWKNTCLLVSLSALPLRAQ